MYKAIVNNKTFEIDQNDQSITVNGTSFEWDINKVSDGYFHILYQNRSYRAEVVTADVATKTISFKINGRNYSVALKDKFDLLLEKMGMNQTAVHKVNSIKAPMPGLIIDLKVKTGDTVKQGDPLLILEAMKMENILKSPGDGLIKNLKVKKGDNVEKGQVLIEF
jgi:biotin carboxyl carrier protein